MRVMRAAISSLSIVAASLLIASGARPAAAQGGFGGRLPGSLDAPPDQSSPPSENTTPQPKQQGSQGQETSPPSPSDTPQPKPQGSHGVDVPLGADEDLHPSPAEPKQAIKQLEEFKATIRKREDPEERAYGSVEAGKATLIKKFKATPGVIDVVIQNLAGDWGGWLASAWPRSLYEYHTGALDLSLDYANNHSSVPSDQWQAIVDGMKKWEEYERTLPPFMARKIDLSAQGAKAYSDRKIAGDKQCGSDAMCQQQQTAATEAANKKLDELEAAGEALQRKVNIAASAKFFTALTDNPNNCTSMTLSYQPAVFSAQTFTATAHLAFAPAYCNHAFGVPAYAITTSTGVKFHIDDTGDLTRDQDAAGSATVQVTYGPLSATAKVATAFTAEPKKPVVTSGGSSQPNSGQPDPSPKPQANSGQPANSDSDPNGNKGGGPNNSGNPEHGGPPGGLKAPPPNVAANTPSGSPPAATQCEQMTLAYSVDSAASAAGLERLRPTIGYKPSNCAPPSGSVSYSSSDPQIATVSEDGTVTGIAAGNVTITAQRNNLTAQAAITVR
jgi:Bacterial Ig-like domain (group 2)